MRNSGRMYVIRFVTVIITIIYMQLSFAAKGSTIDSLKTELAQHAQQDTIKLRILLNISMAYFNGHHDSMMSYSRLALAFSRQLKSNRFIAISLGQVGI